MDNNLITANLTGDELDKLMDLEKTINQKHQDNNKVYLLAFEEK